MLFFVSDCSPVVLSFLYFPIILPRFLVSFQCFLRFFIVFLVFFWYFPFILLRFLPIFQCFLQFCGLFLSIRYTFCCILCSCFADFTCFFNSTFDSLHFAMMSCILKPFPFNWLYVGLISLYFVQVLYRFNVFIWFYGILVSLWKSVAPFGMTNKEENLTQRFPRRILHNYFRNGSPCLFHSSICPLNFPRLICNNINCIRFYQANLITKSQTSNNDNKIQPETTVAKERKMMTT